MPLTDEPKVSVRVKWAAHNADSTVFVPKHLVDAMEADDYRTPYVEEYLSDTFGWLVKEWEVVAT